MLFWPFSGPLLSFLAIFGATAELSGSLFGPLFCFLLFFPTFAFLFLPHLILSFVSLLVY